MTATSGSDLFAPLRARYADWLTMDPLQVEADRDEAAEDIRALQLVLRLERDTPPGWHAAVGLAATVTAKICLDPRAAADGPWHDAIAAYCHGHIRKVTRRARGAQWEAVQDLPGLIVTDGPTQIRALLPGRVTELDKRVAKLQVGGTDAPYDEAAASPRGIGPDDPGVLRMWLPPAPAMSLGKAMAQAGHAAMIAAALLAGETTGADVLAGWVAGGCPATGTRATADQWAELSAPLRNPGSAWSEHRLLAVRDAGFTEIAPGTFTVIAHVPS